MLSILIPTFNYNAYPLVYELASQIEKEKLACEIICFDDGSDVNFEQNNAINTIDNATFKKLPANIGRTATRNQLAKESAYDWLLFVDADMLPKNKDFILKYYNCILSKPPSKVVFGGCSYSQNHALKNSLRFFYGIKREEKSADIRSKNPYKNVLSGNMLIQKSLFIKLNELDHNRYGLDPFFSGQLEKDGILPLHIDNEMYHLGLEANNVFLRKSKESALTVRWLYENNLISQQQSQLIVVHEWLIKMKLISLFRFAGSVLISPIEMLLSKNKAPLFLLDFYRLYFYLTSKNLK